MNFLLRSFLGLIILSITLGFLIFGSFVLIEALKKRSEKSDNRRFQKERVFAVNVETLNKHSTTLELMQKDLEANSEFRIKYPRGELGQSSGEAELFMLVEHMSGLIEQMEEELKGMRNNRVNIDFLKEQVSKLQTDVEKLIRNGSGH